MAYGTLTVGDLLANQNTIAKIGEDQVWESIDIALRVHNSMMQEIREDLCEPTTDQLRRFGGPDAMTMDTVDALGRGDAQKVTAGVNVGFPLYLHDLSIQWNRKYFQNATGKDLAGQFLAATDAHVKKWNQQVRNAIFQPTNKTVVDKLVNNAIILPIKALTNADSGTIPLGPDGTTFNGATHTHYLATASLVAADLSALISTVVEHYGSGRAMVYIHSGLESVIRAMTTAGQFVADIAAQIIPANTTTYTRRALETGQLFDRRIGVFGNQAAEIWVKPWIPANYAFAFVLGAPKPLCVRTRGGGLGIDGYQSGDFYIAADDESYPLRAKTMESEFGVGVWNRTNGAVLYTGGGSYVAPTIAA